MSTAVLAYKPERIGVKGEELVNAKSTEATTALHPDWISLN